MASHDSGVDTSNDSFCTNDNSNNTSITSQDGSSGSNNSPSLIEIWHQSAQNFSSFHPLAAYPECSTSRSFKSPDDRASSKAGTRYRHALVPYVCKLPNERKLRLAASVSNIELLVRLLDNGVSPDACDEHHRTPLHLASSRGCFFYFILCLLLPSN